MSIRTPCMTPADIAKAIAELASLWRHTDEFVAVRTTARYFQQALAAQREDCLPGQGFSFDEEKFWRDCRIEEDHD